MTKTIVVIGGSAAGMGAAGAAKQVDPAARVVVFTELQDVAYSPCGIPYVHGREIDSFDRLILLDKEHYRQQGFEIHYETIVSAINLTERTVEVPGQPAVHFDRLVLGTGFEYQRPDIPGGELDGLYYVRDIRAAERWDQLLDTVKRAVIAEAQPIGVEMATALAHRGIETHLVDPHPWAMAEIADPDIMEPVEQSWQDLGVKVHLNTVVEGILGEGGRVRAVQTSHGELAADVVVMGTKKLPNTALAMAAGIKTGSTAGIIVDPRMATLTANVWAGGDCVEIPQGSTG